MIKIGSSDGLSVEITDKNGNSYTLHSEFSININWSRVNEQFCFILLFSVCSNVYIAKGAEFFCYLSCMLLRHIYEGKIELHSFITSAKHGNKRK